ncbi:hypothetical protein [Salinactinospora qingdaonensis]
MRELHRLLSHAGIHRMLIGHQRDVSVLSVHSDLTVWCVNGRITWRHSTHRHAATTIHPATDPAGAARLLLDHLSNTGHIDTQTPAPSDEETATETKSETALAPVSSPASQTSRPQPATLAGETPTVPGIEPSATHWPRSERSARMRWRTAVTHPYPLPLTPQRDEPATAGSARRKGKPGDVIELPTPTTTPTREAA